MIVAVNDAGNSVPPLFVFPRVNFKQRMLKGVPPSSVGKANITGWSKEEIFVSFLEHFINHVNPSNERCNVLIMDNHSSHIKIIPVINIRIKLLM